MSRKKDKEQVDGLSSKDILISFCSNLGEASCKRAYKLLSEEFNIDRTKTIRLNGGGNVDDSGWIRMTSSQYKKMLAECGEYKFKWLVACLDEYMQYLHQQAELGDIRCKRQLKIYKTTTSYPKLMKGWVMEKYNQYGTPPPDQKSCGRIDFYSIDSLKGAREYIRSIPYELLLGSPELEFLMNKYPELLQDIEEVHNANRR